ncbi:MAG: transcriptional regulator PpsR [Pseudomonadota bacterium]
METSSAANLISAASDIALVLDQDGTIVDLSYSDPEMDDGDFEAWIGKPMTEVVTPECTAKVESMLAEAKNNGSSRRREINHNTQSGIDLPIRYVIVRVGDDDRLVAFGRDIRSLANLQQRLVRTQITMEREYGRLREAEACYRLLFQLSSEAVLIVDPASLTVTDANPAASNILGVTIAKLVGRRASHVVQPADRPAVKALLTEALASGKADKIRARLTDGSEPVDVSASLFRQSETSHLLLRVSVPNSLTGPGESRERTALLNVMERMPDGLVVVNGEQRVVSANSAFIDLIQASDVDQVRDQTVDQWFLRASVDANVLLANLREHGVVRRFPTTLRGELGSTQEVEVTGVSVAADNLPLYGLIFRRAYRALNGGNGSVQIAGQNAEQMTELIGRMSLKEVVRNTTDVIERLCIEAALNLTQDNRASAAQLLGLSRQSLYAKMRRFGLGDLPPETDSGLIGN